MLLVKTILRESKLEGVGLFADEPIAAGSPVWVIDHRCDREFTREELATLPPTARAYVEKYAFVSNATGRFVLVGDHARYINHSDRPNVQVTNQKGDAVARVDIQPGTEITLNYKEISADPLEFVPV